MELRGESPELPPRTELNGSEESESRRTKLSKVLNRESPEPELESPPRMELNGSEESESREARLERALKGEPPEPDPEPDPRIELNGEPPEPDPEPVIEPRVELNGSEEESRELRPEVACPRPPRLGRLEVILDRPELNGEPEPPDPMPDVEEDKGLEPWPGKN